MIRARFLGGFMAAMIAAACNLIMGAERAPPIAVSWRLIGNQPASRFQAELTLTNRGGVPLTNGWALYFNSASRLYPDSIQGDFTLDHINGDFFVLRPKAGSPPMPPARSRSLRWQGGPWAINASDAPSGFYFVTSDPAGDSSRPLPVQLEIEPFPASAQLKRGALDAVAVATPESRFAENEAMTVLPVPQLSKVVPNPAEVEPLSGAVVIRPATVIFYDPTLENEAEFLADELKSLLAAAIGVKPGTATQKDSIQLRIGEVSVGGSIRRAGDEAYTLTANSDEKIEIVGTDPAGVFYGLQTLRAILPPSAYRQGSAELKLEAVRIADAPRFPYRGVHLDVARNFQPKETVKKLLDLMAFYKLNRLHWHLTDDEGWRFEVRALPELTRVGGRRGHTLDEAEYLVPSHGSGPFPDAESSPGSGFYTQHDLVEILQYAKGRHIQVIPELDFPGHARAAVKAMESRHRTFTQQGNEMAAEEFLLREPGDASKHESVQMWRDNVVDVGREATYRFLDTVIAELAEVYQRAGVPLASVHLGGDEVPAGAWEKSKACERIALDAKSKIPRRGQLEIYFLNRASQILARYSIAPACWEDCLLLELGENPSAGHARRAAGTPPPTAYVWNNVWGWGREDAAYRLANAGFDVVISSATHLYFDLAYEKDPQEPGYYWAGFVDTRAPFELVPLDVFKNAAHDTMGQPLDSDRFADRARLMEEGKRHILGIQGQLWGENLRDPLTLEYMAFPRLIALAERAWAKSPQWADIEDPASSKEAIERDWNRFANQLGQRELPRLDYLYGGVNYRLPPPGAVSRDGVVMANAAFPGLEIRYTTDGTEPTNSAPLYVEPIPASKEIRLKTFDTRGRGSRSVTVSSR